MDWKTRLTGRNAAPPAAGAAARSNEKDGKNRSKFDSFKKTFRASYLPDITFDPQATVLSRLKDLKGGITALKGTRASAQVNSASTPLLLASAGKAPHVEVAFPPIPSEADHRDDTKVQMPSHAVLASQKRKLPQEHDDAPSRTKPKSRPAAVDTAKRHNVQHWVDQQDAPISPTAVTMISIDGDSHPLSLTPPIMDDHERPHTDGADSRSPTHASVLERVWHGSLRRRKPSREELASSSPEEAILRGRSSASHESEPQPVTTASHLFKSDARRRSTATTSISTYRDSMFSCPSVATGLTSSSEISLALTAAQRVSAASRTSSFFSKTSPRSSIGVVPSPPLSIYRCVSPNSAVRFTEPHDWAAPPLPILPPADPLKSNPTFFGMDLEDVQNAVTIDQVVKVGHSAQERRADKRPLFDPPQLLVVPIVSAPKELTPIKEAASDDGASSGRRSQLHVNEPTSTEHLRVSTPPNPEMTDSAPVGHSGPETPESSSNQLSDVSMTSCKASQSITPTTSVTQILGLAAGEESSQQSEDFDDSVSDITHYTEESLYEAVEALGPSFSNPLMLSIILTFKDDVVRLVLAQVKAVLGDNNGTTQHNNGEGSSSTRAQTSSNGSSQQSNQSSQPNRSLKRELHNSDDRSGDNGDDDKGKRPRPASALPTDLERRYRKLACPYFKRFPERKWKGACCKPGFPSVHRVKEHIYRKHEHHYCPRCYAIFAKEEELTEHARAEPPCTVPKEPVPLQGITRAQHDSLRSRKRPDGKKDVVQTEEQKWEEVYLILFPTVPRDRIPSPYVDLEGQEETLSPDGAPARRQFLAEQLHALLARELQERLQLTEGADSAFLQTQLPEIIQNCIRQALSNMPPQILGREESALTETHDAPPASASPDPDSHGTAQIGSQFASASPPPAEETLVPHEQDIPEEVTLPDVPQPWLGDPQHDLDNALFSETWFPDPFAAGTNTEANFTHYTHDDNNNAAQQQVLFANPHNNAFNTTGFPSAMLADSPVLSPALTQGVPSEEWRMHDEDMTSFHFQGNLGNMANLPFLYMHDEKGQGNGSMMDRFISQ